MVGDPGPEANEKPPMARLASNLRRTASPTSVTLEGPKSEITKWRRRSANDAESVANIECSTFPRDSTPTTPPMSKKFRAKTISLTSLMIALSRRERERTFDSRPCKHQILQEEDENVWLARTAAPQRDPPQRRWKDPTLRRAETSLYGNCRHWPSFHLVVLGIVPLLLAHVLPCLFVFMCL